MAPFVSQALVQVSGSEGGGEGLRGVGGREAEKWRGLRGRERERERTREVSYTAFP